MILRLGSFIAVLVVSFAVLAQPAPWYKWRSKLNGKEVCAQTSPGEGWEQASGPYKSDCKTPY